MTGSTSNHSHSLSYPRVPSRTTDARSLVSVQSEGSSLQSRLAPRRSGKSGSIAPLPIRDRNVRHAEDNSSDESGGEEVIVRIDSPSRLSFNQASGT